MVRPNTAVTFPRHVFLRAPNLHASVNDRVGNRYKFYFKYLKLIEKTVLMPHCYI